jgi:hypothetical protein
MDPGSGCDLAWDGQDSEQLETKAPTAAQKLSFHGDNVSRLVLLFSAGARSRVSTGQTT